MRLIAGGKIIEFNEGSESNELFLDGDSLGRGSIIFCLPGAESPETIIKGDLEEGNCLVFYPEGESTPSFLSEPIKLIE